MNFFPTTNQKLFRSNHSACLALAAGILICAGCGKKPAVPTAQSTAPVPATASAAAQPDTEAMLGQLTQVLRKYSFEHRRVPASFSELMGTDGAGQTPAAPAGKKFAIDPKAMQVVLVNR